MGASFFLGFRSVLWLPFTYCVFHIAVWSYYSQLRVRVWSVQCSTEVFHCALCDGDSVSLRCKRYHFLFIYFLPFCRLCSRRDTQSQLQWKWKKQNGDLPPRPAPVTKRPSYHHKDNLISCGSSSKRNKRLRILANTCIKEEEHLGLTQRLLHTSVWRRKSIFHRGWLCV